ncbi:hypothetical protein H5410_051827 [Solanum commersonii]|uniref:Uncharacterized protein n=1 Tax=Solanum commersonii TaxID=4109 RepID=A0A9J5X268_SOLCO|nr:hypothetical protein H5410_051827 [Solanum commersonii]
MPIYFGKADLPFADLPNQPEQTQHAPAHGRVPQASPIVILGAHVVALYEPHVQPIYAIGAPTFTIPAVLKEDASINSQLQGLRKALKSLQVTRGTESLDYDDLCIHPDIDMSVGYKPLKFDMFDGKGDPHAHLRKYCNKLVDESELSKYFIQAQEGVYFDKMMSIMGQKFAELVKMGDFIEEGVKSGKIQSMVALQPASRAIQSSSIGGIKKKREDISGH